MYTYSFEDTSLALNAPSDNIDLSRGGNSKEGFDFAPTQENGFMEIGADGSVAHYESADRSGTLTLRLLQNSDLNQRLQDLLNRHRSPSGRQEKIDFVIRNAQIGELSQMRDCRFKTQPGKSWKEKGTMREWTFNVGSAYLNEGSSSPSISLT